jgi:NTE family protein
MKLKLDRKKTYAIALQGGGAKGGFEVGVWMALNEAGIRYNAVSGTSVGALIGALMTTGELETAKRVWEDMSMDKVLYVEPEYRESLRAMVSKRFGLDDLREFAPGLKQIAKSGGLDISPLRKLIGELADPAAIKSSGVELYVTTLDLSEMQGLTVRVNDLPDESVCDMLLASAYHPSFRQEPIGGKYYTDGGFVDALPIAPLVENGYRDIIAVMIPGLGNSRSYDKPEGLKITFIEPRHDLGRTLNFDAEQGRRDMRIGYLDACRVLYGLKGKKYYLDKTLKESEALTVLANYYARTRRRSKLRQILEFVIPTEAIRLGVPTGNYYDILTALCESLAEDKGMEQLKLYTDTDFIREAMS